MWVIQYLDTCLTEADARDAAEFWRSQEGCWGARALPPRSAGEGWRVQALLRRDDVREPLGEGERWVLVIPATVRQFNISLQDLRGYWQELTNHVGRCDSNDPAKDERWAVFETLRAIRELQEAAWKPLLQ